MENRKAKAAPWRGRGASGNVVAGAIDTQKNTPNTDEPQAATERAIEAREAVETLCEVRDWLRHSAGVMERLTAAEQEMWAGEPGGAPEIPLTVEQAQGLARA